jgi:hypothetical protein
MQIRIHKDNTTAEAVADMLKLNIGDVLEQRKDILDRTSFATLIEDEKFKKWLIEIMQINKFSQIQDGSSFNMNEVEKVKISDEFINEVFSILAPMAKREFVQYRIDLINEASKKNPNIIEV